MCALPNGEISVILSNSKVAVSAIKESVLPEGKNIEVLTMQSIKGLEAQNVIIHNFLSFLQTIYKNERELFYRKIYVLLTRSRENLYISLPKNLDENLPDEIKQVIEVIKKYASITQDLPPKNEEIKEKIKPKTSLYKASFKRCKRGWRASGDGQSALCHHSRALCIVNFNGSRSHNRIRRFVLSRQKLRRSLALLSLQGRFVCG